MIKILKSFVVLLGLVSLATLSTQAVFTSQASIENNQFSTGEWEGEPEPTPSPTPSESPSPTLHVVINEVYHTPDSAHRINEQAGKNEWIELYNPTNQVVNIKDWQIITDSYSRTISANKNIPANSFILLSHDGSTWTYWTLPSGIDTADLGTAPNNYMRLADSIKLKDNSNNLIDQFDYTGGIEGHSFERDPDGSANIVDKSSPTPGS